MSRGRTRYRLSLDDVVRVVPFTVVHLVAEVALYCHLFRNVRERPDSPHALLGSRGCDCDVGPTMKLYWRVETGSR